MVSARCAVATLLYSTDYLPGVFTLGHQLAKLLRNKGNIRTCLVVSKELWSGALSELSKTLVRLLYNDIVLVDPLQDQDSTVERNAENLRLLNRPELSFALIKARLWELTQFDRVLYLDADTLPLNEEFLNIFELIPQQESRQIGGAPDIGWPDMFNSGVLMLRPDINLASELHKFILSHTSIDGADQGILNQFFNPYCAETDQGPSRYSWVRLPFIYNVTVPNYGYQSSPAVRYFQSQIRLVHFIGENKPWKGWLSGSSADGYVSRWGQVYNEFLERFGLTQFFEEMGLQRPTAPEPRQENAAPLANWEEFHQRVMQQEPESIESYDSGHLNVWRVEPPQESAAKVINLDGFDKPAMQQEPEGTKTVVSKHQHVSHAESPQESAVQVVDWDSFNKRIMQEEPESTESYDTGHVGSWHPGPVVARDHTERVFPDVDQYDTNELTKQLGEFSVAGTSDSSSAPAPDEEVAPQITATSGLPIPLSAAHRSATLQNAARKQLSGRVVERVFPNERDLPHFSQPKITGTRPEDQDNVQPVPRVEEVLEMIKEDCEPDPVPRHVFDWEETNYLQEVERVFPD
ncbi:hypothetical protein HG536_0F00970 [Torulaspora globosa]|uniref:glycogenin glucosyltransferase n=1 Tax=Torulaspora globosa TaxID=48254 RepID=A0A7G3ZJT6_9SACH|nr:uncharacterized protein HG536_0F00970 [Torulaspora globosa]QLL33772.1 hypothetical protein HG536_0F00970 [Torulaspora globosa]